MAVLPLIILGCVYLAQSRLADERCEQSVNIILQEQVDVGVHGGLKRTVEQCHFPQIEMLRVDFTLSLGLGH